MELRVAINLVEAAMATPPSPDGPPPPAGFKPLLRDRYEIAEYICDQSPKPLDQEMIEEYFRGAKAVLRLIPVTEISEGSADTNIRVKSREAKYRKLPQETMPPLVVEGGKIMDGNHRFRVAVAKGATALWCYDCVDG